MIELRASAITEFRTNSLTWQIKKIKCIECNLIVKVYVINQPQVTPWLESNHWQIRIWVPETFELELTIEPLGVTLLAYMLICTYKCLT